MEKGKGIIKAVLKVLILGKFAEFRYRVTLLENKYSKIINDLANLKTELSGLKETIACRANLASITNETLPDFLKKTFLALKDLGEANASMVAAKTNRARAVESQYLNWLVREGYATAKRRSREKFFSLNAQDIQQVPIVA